MVMLHTLDFILLNPCRLLSSKHAPASSNITTQLYLPGLGVKRDFLTHRSVMIVRFGFHDANCSRSLNYLRVPRAAVVVIISVQSAALLCAVTFSSRKFMTGNFIYLLAAWKPFKYLFSFSPLHPRQPWAALISLFISYSLLGAIKKRK